MQPLPASISHHLLRSPPYALALATFLAGAAAFFLPLAALAFGFFAVVDLGLAALAAPFVTGFFAAFLAGVAFLADSAFACEAKPQVALVSARAGGRARARER